MNEEEKKAMFQLEDLENDKEHLIIEQRQAITTILNLIDKQQKEIEELNKSDTSKEQSSMNYYNLYKELEDKLKEIVDECIPKKENIITRELEYTPNANANSYLTQEILSLLEKE